MHCCYGGYWPSRLGGIAALNRLVPRLPPSALPHLAPVAAKAVFAVLRILPEYSIEEQELGAVLQLTLQRCGATGTSMGGTQRQPVQKCHEGSVPSQPDTDSAVVADLASPCTSPIPPNSTVGSSRLDEQAMPALLKQMMEIFVQQLLSSRSSLAARTVASGGLQV